MPPLSAIGSDVDEDLLCLQLGMIHAIDSNHYIPKLIRLDFSSNKCLFVLLQHMYRTVASQSGTALNSYWGHVKVVYDICVCEETCAMLSPQQHVTTPGSVLEVFLLLAGYHV